MEEEPEIRRCYVTLEREADLKDARIARENKTIMDALRNIMVGYER
jgi:hypothetical protein